MNPGLLNLLNMSNTSVGHALVSPGFHADPRFLSEEARDSSSLFSSRMLSHQYHAELTPLDIPNQGATDKVHFRVGGHRDADGKLQPSSVFMVKPYYENLSTYQYGHYPLSGWAEMAYHGLLNASGLEHLGMRVHAFPYHDSALLGVELEPDLAPVFNTQGSTKWNPQTKYGRVEFSSGAKDDAAKIGALDFLTNNQDRNSCNVLVSADEKGQAHSILPIDNGRSMQYMESHNLNARHGNVDNLFHYLSSYGLQPIVGESLHTPINTIVNWWMQNKPRLIAEMHKHIDGIKHVELATHIANSFSDRAMALDNLATDFTAHGAKPYEDFLHGDKNGSSTQLFHRAGVRIRKWEPKEDPQPLELKSDKQDYRLHSLSCPTCGEDFQST